MLTKYHAQPERRVENVLSIIIIEAEEKEKKKKEKLKVVCLLCFRFTVAVETVINICMAVPKSLNIWRGHSVRHARINVSSVCYVKNAPSLLRTFDFDGFICDAQEDAIPNLPSRSD